MKTNTMTLTINNSEYAGVPVELAQTIEKMLAGFKVTATKAKTTTKTAPKAEPEKKYAKVYSVLTGGKGVTVGNDGFIPTKVFKGVTYSLKLAGAKYDKDTKAWMFGTKKACTEWCKAQDARG